MKYIADDKDCIWGEEKVMRKFKIQGEYDQEDGEPLYWANDFGWTDFYNGTEFSENEKTEIDFPMGAKYIRWTDTDGEYTWCKENLEKIN